MSHAPARPAAPFTGAGTVKNARGRRAGRGIWAKAGRTACGLAALGGLGLTAGCSAWDARRATNRDRREALEQVPVIRKVDYAPPACAAEEHDPRDTLGLRPNTLRTAADGEVEFWDLELRRAIDYAIANSKVMRDLGARVLRSPEAVPTRYEPALQYTDARFGPEAALSAFDAQLTSQLSAQNNDRVINNRFFGGGIQLFQQDLVTSRTELSKRTATGTRFALRNVTEYDANNAPANQFPSAYNTFFEGEVRHPLLRGGGVTFNRIAGPDGVPGFYNGVVIARVNNEISQAEFETGLRDFLSDVTNAYWELYYAYRNLEARKAARDRALAVWDAYRARAEGGLAGETNSLGSENEALAREQYYRFQEEVEEALSGRPIEFTFTGSGRGGGTFRAGGGVQVAERRLRLLMGVAVNDDRMVRPVLEDELSTPDVLFDWGTTAAGALERRPELRRQKLRVRRSKMELTAAQNFLSPQLDLIARHRFRGFGDDLLDNDGVLPVLREGSNAFGTLTTGDFQESEFGFELSVPLGFRRAHAAVQNAELSVARETALLREQERQVIYDLSNAVAEKDRAYQALQTGLNRYRAAKGLLDALEVRAGLDAASLVKAGEGEEVGTGKVNLDKLLDAQRRVTDAELAVFRARAAYEVAIKNIFFESGSLFDYHRVHVAANGGDGVSVPAPAPPAPAPAADDAAGTDDAGTDDAGETGDEPDAAPDAPLDGATDTPDDDGEPAAPPVDPLPEYEPEATGPGASAPPTRRFRWGGLFGGEKPVSEQARLVPPASAAEVVPDDVMPDGPFLAPLVAE